MPKDSHDQHHGHGGGCDAHDSDHRALLRAAGLRATPARLAILDTLCHASAAMDAQQVQGVLAAAAASSSLSELKTDRVTVYRTLNSLAEAGIAHRVDAGDRVFRYAMAGGHAAHSPSERRAAVATARTGPAKKAEFPGGRGVGHEDISHHAHPHFVCDSCGRIECLEHLELLMRSVGGRGRRGGRRSGQGAAAARPRQPDLRGRRLVRMQVMLYGLCEGCASPGAGGDELAASRSSKR